MALWQELKQRNVVKVGAVYLAVSWLVTQVVDTINEPLGLPESFDTIVIVVLAIGFPIALIFAWAFELTPEGVRRTGPDSSSETATTAAPNSRFNVFVTTVLALAVVVLVIDRFVLDSGPAPAVTAGRVEGSVGSEGATPSAATALAEPALEDRIRVAVLPLRTLSADEELSWFADGLTEQLILNLRQIPELLIPDRGASFAFRDSALALPDIAAQLGVAHVLDGSLAANNEDLRISVALTRTSDNAQLWQMQRDFAREELFDVQDEIREQVATALSVSLGVLTRRDEFSTTNVEAYTAFLTGRGIAQRFTAAAMLESIAQFQRAIALDPDFIAPRVALHLVHAFRSTLVPEEEARQALREANETLELLREMAPDIAVTRQADAARNLVEGNWAGLEEILASEPDQATTLGDEGEYHTIVGQALYRLGRHREGIRRMEIARALAPLNAGVAFNLATFYQAEGRLDAGLAEAERGLTLASDSATLNGLPLLSALARRDPEVLAGAIATTDELGYELWDDLVALVDDPAAGIAEVRRRFEENVEETSLAIGLLAHWANFFGAPELALEITRSLIDEPGVAALILWDYGMRDARRLPEFKTVVAEMGLVTYWREYGWPDFCRPVGDDFECA